MKKQLAFHPLLFAVLAVISFYVSAVNLYLPDKMLLPAASALAWAAGLWGGLTLAFKDQQRAALVTTIIVSALLFFKAPYDGLKSVVAMCALNAPGEDACLVVWLLLAVSAVCFAVLTRRNMERATALLNLAAIFLVGMKLFVVALHLLSEPPEHNFDLSLNLKPATVARGLRTSPSEQAQTGKQMIKPDIYYIILDGYANPDVYKKYFGYDNGAFIQALGAEGFHIYSGCHPNYQMTMLSIPSSLNMDYLNDYIPSLIGTVSSDWWPLDRLMQDHAVGRFLKANGYRYIHCSSGWGASNYNPYASTNIECGWMDQFFAELMLTTAYGPLERRLHFLRDAISAKKLAIFASLPDIQKEPGPKFVFVHVLLPHPPYLFCANGEPSGAGMTPYMDGSDYRLKKPYLEQSIFAEKKAQEAIRAILSRPGDKPVIVLQSDHGSSSCDTNAFNYKPSDAYLGERMRIFNAYYFPHNAPVAVYDGITPVNSFRAIFNYYFDAGFPLLKDEVYYSPYAAPFKLVNVTTRMPAADKASPGSPGTESSASNSPEASGHPQGAD